MAIVDIDHGEDDPYSLSSIVPEELPAMGNGKRPRCKENSEGWLEEEPNCSAIRELMESRAKMPNEVTLKGKELIFDFRRSLIPENVLKSKVLRNRFIERSKYMNLVTTMHCEIGIREWLDTFVPTCITLNSAYGPVAKLLCFSLNYQYAEVWRMRITTASEAEMHLQQFYVHSDLQGAQKGVGRKLHRLGKHSMTTTIDLPSECCVGRAAQTETQSECDFIPSRYDAASQRTMLMYNVGIKKCLAVPLMLAGKYRCVMAFYGIREDSSAWSKLGFIPAYVALMFGNRCKGTIIEQLLDGTAKLPAKLPSLNPKIDASDVRELVATCGLRRLTETANDRSLSKQI